MYSPLLRVMRSGSRFEELKDLLMLFRSEIGTDTHVHHNHFPLCRTVIAGRSYVMAAHAIVGPKFRPTFSSRSGSNFARLLIVSAADQPSHGQGQRRNNYDGSG